mmetsp:Transcript_1151/g.2356  ORF Transcript_1151/g.2356 Transcript_1151/m.2356 type:complete len:502 (-) Transcript_1151:917-2422(-)
MADELLSEFATVEAAYGENAASARERLSDMYAMFEKDFGAVPSVCARSPGRVNLIGEHIDYEGYGVLPMAIALDTVVAIRKNSSRDVITLRNTQSDTYGELTFPMDPDQHVDTGKHTWGNYVIGAYKGVFEYLKKHHPDKVPEPVGLDVLVDGRVPTGSGLSSSAAIVCSSAIAMLEVLGVPRLRKGEVAEFTALAERYVGVISGGMDQAISIMGKEGVAQLIEFNPVRASPVIIPDDSVFVIANSLTVSNKAESATGRYNLRVVECRLASAVLAKSLGVEKRKAIEYKTLEQVESLVDEWCLKKTEPLDQSMPNWCVAAVCDFLHEAPYSTREIEDILGCKVTELFDDEASKHVLDTFDSFKLHHRALHVYSEKQRVFDFAQICADTRYDADKARQLLGSLMDMSHTSCSTSYECSSPELDALVKVAKDNGALGSRLTGAGWGGCTVSLVKKDMVDTFLKQVKEQYYGPLLKSGRIDEASMDVTLFASPPASGGGILNNV